jgi:hypothetical protein
MGAGLRARLRPVQRLLAAVNIADNTGIGGKNDHLSTPRGLTQLGT